MSKKGMGTTIKKLQYVLFQMIRHLHRQVQCSIQFGSLVSGMLAVTVSLIDHLLTQLF